MTPERRMQRSFSSRDFDTEPPSEDAFSLEDKVSAIMASDDMWARDGLQQVNRLAQRDNFNVQAWRAVVLIFVLVVGLAVSMSTFVVLAGEANDDDLSKYKLFVKNIQDNSNLQRNNMYAGILGLADRIATEAVANRNKNSNTTSKGFPFVTVPLFEVAGQHARIQSGVKVLTYCPLVSDTEREDWETYAEQQQGWLAESQSVVQSRGEALMLDQKEEQDATTNILPFVWGNSRGNTVRKEIGSNRYLPMWKSSPPPAHASKVMNLDALENAEVGRAMEALEQTREAVLGGLTYVGDQFPSVESSRQNAFHSAYMESMLGNSTTSLCDHPHSVLYQPVWDRLHDNGAPEPASLVGVIMAVVTWDTFLTNLLPQGVNGIHVVLQNSCGQVHTYVLNGNEAVYLGPGDLHNKDYDHTEEKISQSHFQDPNSDQVDGLCQYWLLTYASDAFMSDARTSLPGICTIVVAAIFVLMAITFTMYDKFVRQRNDKVVKAAARANAIISSLFPSNVRDRLFAERDQQSSEPPNRNSHKMRLKSYLNHSVDNNNNSDSMDNQGICFRTKPIADLFLETTILFGDISGFTAWSSVREPSQVFTLLETLYHAFDESASKRGVFKVETVGDCYVAVTGLPDPQNDHAVVMARFANDCMLKTKELTKKLEVILGPDTADLTMRIGLHSGPVTAGVLRGERSRFQLFGDTMNTQRGWRARGFRAEFKYLKILRIS